MVNSTPNAPASPIKPAGRTLTEFKPLKPAELKLLEACRTGTLARISEKCPEQPDEQNIVRADFLRFLALGGDEHAPLHEMGVTLQGAWMDGVLNLVSATIRGSLWLFKCRFRKKPLLSYSYIHGGVHLEGSHVEGLEAGGMVCNGSVSLNGVTANRTINLMGAEIGGNLYCNGAKFHGITAPDGKIDDALSCVLAVVKNDVSLTDVTAIGRVNLLGVKIGGNLSCNGVNLDGKGNVALSFERGVIKSNVFLTGQFTAVGMVSLLGAQIGGNLECNGAKFHGNTAPDGKVEDALSCALAVVKNSVLLVKGFTATGRVCLSGAQIGGDLFCVKADFDGRDGIALAAEGMAVVGSFFFRQMLSPVRGILLDSAKVGQLVDDAESWAGDLHLDGFVYDRLTEGAPTDAESRLEWLNKQYDAHLGLGGEGFDFRPQPWRQLQKVLVDMGHMEGSRLVAIAFEDRLRYAGLIGQTPTNWYRPVVWLYRNICSGFHWLFWLLTGYGYRPLRLIGWMLCVWLFCGLFYWYAALHGVFAPSNPLVFQNPDYAACVPDSDAAKVELHKSACAMPPYVQGAGNWYLCGKLREEYTGFSPLAYSLDVILPLVDLQQEQGWASMIPTPKSTWYEELFAISLKHVSRWLVWFEILFGWVASLLLVAVVSGLTKRRGE